MTGDKKSSQDKLKLFEKILDEYISTTGLPHIVRNSEVEGVLSLTRDELKGMTAEDCGINSFLLQQYATYIQKEHNRNNVRVQWATRELSLIVATQESRFRTGDYMKYELLLNKIICGDIAAAALSKIVKYASARATELDQLSSKIGMMGRALIELQQTKRFSHNPETGAVSRRSS